MKDYLAPVIQRLVFARFDPHRIQVDVLSHFTDIRFAVFQNKRFIAPLKHMAAEVVAGVVHAGEECQERAHEDARIRIQCQEMDVDVAKKVL